MCVDSLTFVLAIIVRHWRTEYTCCAIHEHAWVARWTVFHMTRHWEGGGAIYVITTDLGLNPVEHFLELK